MHCNDCGADSEEAFHVMGQRCGGSEGCGSFNTRRVGIQKRPPTAEQRRQVWRSHRAFYFLWINASLPSSAL